MGFFRLAGSIPASRLLACAPLPENAVNILLPVLVFTAPVLLIVFLTVAFGRKLSGSCGGVDADGRCSRCGKPAPEIPTSSDRRESCP